MTSEEVLQLAREAGITAPETLSGIIASRASLERFAALVLASQDEGPLIEYEVRVDDEWFASADRLTDALAYAHGYVEEAQEDVRVYVKRTREVAVLKRSQDD